MAVLTSTPEPQHHPKRKHQSKQPPPPPSSSSSWDQIKNLLSCKKMEDSNPHKPSNRNIYSSCSKICTLRDVVHANTRIVHRSDKSPEQSSKKSGCTGPSGGGGGAPYTGKGMQLRKLSGCYECHTILDPTTYPLQRTNIFSCSKCGQSFPKIQSLELHQAVSHAVSELGPDDSSRNIVEIIFKSSWLKKENPICEIQRILKVHNTQRTIQRFEDYRASVKLRAKRNARCAADGNELLRFYAATLTCALGAGGSSSLCGSIEACGVCWIIRHGFQRNKVSGIRTTASSGRADDCLGGSATRRAMLVCRVIAGRVKPRVAAADEAPDNDSYDSLAGCAGVYSSTEELYAFSSRAILPCFVVIYKVLES